MVVEDICRRCRGSMLEDTPAVVVVADISLVVDWRL